MAKGKQKVFKCEHEKTLICISDIAEKGKTSTVNAVLDILLQRFPTHTILQHQNTPITGIPILRILNINNHIIGFDLMGDPDTDFPARIDRLGAYPCEAIVCTTRSSGATLEAAIATAVNYNMLFIKTSTYQNDDNNLHNYLNGIKAEHIIDILERRGHL